MFEEAYGKRIPNWSRKTAIGGVDRGVKLFTKVAQLGPVKDMPAL